MTRSSGPLRLSRERIPLRTASVRLVLALLLLAIGAGSASARTSTEGKAKKPVVSYLTKLIAAAKKEGSLTWYSAIPLSTTQPVADAFSAKYGIKVNVFQVSSGPLADRYASERAADTVNADVINVADPVFFQDGTSKGWWVTLTKKNLPALASWPAKGLSLHTSALVGIQPIGIAYNKNLVTQPPNTWDDLLDPKYQGHILLTDPSATPAWMATYKLLRERLAAGYLTKLMNQSPSWVSSSNPGAQQLAAGNAWLNLPTSATALVSVQQAGAPVGFVIPSPTTGVEMWMAVSTAAPHPYAGRLFLNFSLSAQAQELFNKGVGASLLPNIPGTLALPARYYTPDIAGALRDRADLLAALGRS